MKAIDLIQNDVPPIKFDESIEKALSWMDEFKVNHLPVVSGSEFVGLISDDMIYDFNNSKELSLKLILLVSNSLFLEMPIYFKLCYCFQIIT